MKPKLSIVIAVWDALAHLVECVESIERWTSVDYELILVDNASTDGAGGYCDEVKKKADLKWQLGTWVPGAPSHTVRVIHNATNRGFGPAQNQGLENATGEFVCSLNSDVVVTPHWFEQLSSALDAPNEFPVAFVGPVSCMSGGRQVVKKGYTDLRDLPRFAAQWNAEHRGQLVETGVLFGWCVFGRKETWNQRAAENEPGKYQPFDERFQNAFEDNDLSLRCTLAGQKLMIVADTYLHHTGQATILSHMSFEAYAKNGPAQRKLFIEKWQKPGQKKLVAVMRLGDCERWIQGVLDNTARFADQILVLLCRSNDKTAEICAAHPKVTWMERYDGPFQEDYERDTLLQEALKLHAKGQADWCISVDGDELYEDRIVQKIQALMNPPWPHVMAYYANWRTIWQQDPDGTEWYRADDTFGSFKNYRLWRLFPGQRIVSKHPEGHHCGSAPVFPVENLKWTNIRVKHMGYDTPEQRFKKFLFYQKNDNFKTARDIGHDDYRHLIDRQVKLRRWRDKNTLSIVALVGNEGGWQMQFPEHLTGLVDEYVLVNTLKPGQESDGTWDYIKRWAEESPVPVKLVDIPWNDNYALMRNMAKEHATSDWILMMDPDERIDEANISLILDMIDEEIDAYAFHCINYLEPARGDGKPPRFVSSDSIRLFRNIPTLFYTGIVHETLEDAVQFMNRRREGCRMGFSAVPIHHHGYLKPAGAVRRKMGYYAELNRRQIEVTDGTDPRPMFSLSLDLLENDDKAGAIELMDKAIELDPTLWRVRSSRAATRFKMAQEDIRAVLSLTQVDTPAHQQAKKTLELLEQMPFRQEKIVFDGSPRS